MTTAFRQLTTLTTAVAVLICSNVGLLHVGCVSLGALTSSASPAANAIGACHSCSCAAHEEHHSESRTSGEGDSEDSPDHHPEDCPVCQSFVALRASALSGHCELPSAADVVDEISGCPAKVYDFSFTRGHSVRGPPPSIDEPSGCLRSFPLA